MNAPRRYTMSARADAVARTRRAILRAAFDLSWEETAVDITFNRVAERAGVSVRTVIRQFGDRDGLFDGLRVFAREEMTAERSAALGGTLAHRVHHLVGHYESRGDGLIRFLAQEMWDERLTAGIEQGRRGHRQWVHDAFDDELPPDPDAREVLVDQLVVVTDVYAWKLLRRDRGLDRNATEARMTAMVTALCGGV